MKNTAKFVFFKNVYGHAKFEKGSVATPWTQAPEDYI